MLASGFILAKPQLEKCYSKPGKFRDTSTVLCLYHISKI